MHITEQKPTLDIRETGADRGGSPQKTDRRLFCQLHVFTGLTNAESVVSAFKKSGLEGVVYLDVNDPTGVGILVFSEDPGVFTGEARTFFASAPFSTLRHRPELTMLGRTYSAGREADLEDWLLVKPRRNALNPEFKWAVWYPLRRKSEFALLSPAEQGKILGEHAHVGRSYGEAGFAHDIRLACYGIDQNDNEFVLGLLSRELYPLSRLVQDMRKTRQTANYIQSMGPFFVGQVVCQSKI